MFLKQYVKGIYEGRYVLMSLVNRDLQMKYRHSKLGIAWSILMPLGVVVIVGGVYSILFHADPKVFIPTLFAGLNPWLFLSGSADAGTVAFVCVEGSLKQTTVPPQIYPLRVIITNFVNLMYSILAFFSTYLFLHPDLFGPRMLMCIPGLAIMFIFALGWANLTSIINLYLRDFQPMQSLVLQSLFYATPIIYPKEQLAAQGFSILYEINPFYYMLEIVRAPMLGIELPSPSVYLIALGISFGMFLFGTWMLMKKKSEVVYML